MLNPEQQEQAEALLDIGFSSSGKTSATGKFDDSDIFIECWHGWKFYADIKGDSYLYVVCNGVSYWYSLFLYCEPDFNQTLSEAKTAIHNVVLKQRERQEKEPKQLTLFGDN